MSLSIFGIKFKSRRLLAGVAALSFAVGLSAAQAMDEVDDAPEWPEKLSKYEPTGQYENCLGVTRIKQSKIIDKQHILFKTNGGKDYVVTLTRKCHSLASYRGISYATSLHKLCAQDIINVFDGGTRWSYGSCGLDKFELVTEKEVDQDQDAM